MSSDFMSSQGPGPPGSTEHRGSLRRFEDLLGCRSRIDVQTCIGASYCSDGILLTQAFDSIFWKVLEV